MLADIVISIHAPREGSDSDVKNYLNITWISIHAPREGSDTTLDRYKTQINNFNPRSP